MNNKEIRWKQRFENYKNSVHALKRAVEIKDPSETEKGGIIQFYEVSFELAWKVIKDYLESEGYIVKSPRESIKLAFQIELIENGEAWLKALDDRNLTTHIYDEQVANAIVNKIKITYYPLLLALFDSLKDK